MLSNASVSRLFLRGPFTKTSCFTKSIYKQPKTLVFNNQTAFSTRNNPRRTSWKTQSIQTRDIETWRLIAGGAAVAGFAGTCLYGLASPAKSGTMSSALEQSMVWPSYVAQRIHSTYAYMIGTVGMASGTAVALLRNPAFVRFVSRGGWAVPIGMFVAVCGSQITMSSIQYPRDGSKLNAKHAAWALFAASLGAMVSPILLLATETAVLSQACIYTGAILTTLSGVAVTAPSDRFLMLAGPLSIGFGVVFIASLGSLFMSPMSGVGMGLYKVSVYGGLALFSGFLLYDTQQLVNRAKQLPPPDSLIVPYDPINSSTRITMDLFNIFVRLVSILSGNSRKK